MARPRYARPTDAELQILAIFWRRGGCTVRQVFKELSVMRGSGYNSALKLIQIMHEKKGYLKRDDSQRPQVYTANVSEAAIKKLLIRDLIKRVFGSGSALVLDTLRSQKLPASELSKIQTALNKTSK